MILARTLSPVFDLAQSRARSRRKEDSSECSRRSFVRARSVTWRAPSTTHCCATLGRDCRSIMISPWYRHIFRTRLAAHRNAVQEFITTRQGYRLATSTGGVLTGRGADIILIDDPLKPE